MKGVSTPAIRVYMVSCSQYSLPYMIILPHGRTGPISSISSMSTTVIIINNVHVANELLEKRSSNTSDRCLPEFGEMYVKRHYAVANSRLPTSAQLETRVGIGLATSLLPYGPELKYHRKLIQSYVNTRATMDYVEEVEELEARRLLVRLLDRPLDYFQHVRTLVLLPFPICKDLMIDMHNSRYPGAVILKVSHGYTISPKGIDKLIRLAERALDEIVHATMTPGKWAINSYPFCRTLLTAFVSASENLKPSFCSEISS